MDKCAASAPCGMVRQTYSVYVVRACDVIWASNDKLARCLEFTIQGHWHAVSQGFGGGGQHSP